MACVLGSEIGTDKSGTVLTKMTPKVYFCMVSLHVPMEIFVIYLRYLDVGVNDRDLHVVHVTGIYL